MRLISLVLGLFMSFSILPASAVTFEDTQQIEEQLLQPSIQLYDDDGTCSGTIVKSELTRDVGLMFYRNTILTAKHCVTEKEYGDVIGVSMPLYDGIHLKGVHRFGAIVVLKSPFNDLALLQYDTYIKQPTASIGDQDVFDNLRIGLDVVAVGYPYSASLTYSPGNLGPIESGLGMFGPLGGKDFQRATTQAGPGASGCGLFIKYNGEYRLIGVLTGGMGSKENFVDFAVYFTPLDKILYFLKENS